jgi:hypothetical protein
VVELLVAAATELSATAAFYDEHRAGYGDRFLDEAQGVFDLLARMPRAGSPWLLEGIPKGVRHIPLRTFPISIVYVTEPRVVVVAFVGTQDPTYWVDRLDDLE